MKTNCSILLAAAVATLGGAAFTGCASSDHDHSGPAHGVAAKPYPLTKCLVTDETFEHGQPYTSVYDGQELKLCCKDCRADFE